ncbi:MAG: arginine--tRNA ligase [Candidatus Pacearchaeota archaeon]|nr:MAG: arginine--tRNA ligase [Candidatus Pacearchaeota archaeon]
MKVFEEKIKGAIAKVTKLKKKEITLREPFGTATKFGDITFPCFDLAKKKKKKKNPKEIAKEIANKLKKKLPNEIDKVEAVGGYINFFISKDSFTKNTIEKILKEKNKYGCLGLKGKALIEHTSINPNASPHVGRVRNAIIGDILSRLLKFHGYKTDIHYYVNDVSKQMALLILGSKGDESFDDLLNLYVFMSDEMKKKPEIEKKVFEILRKVEDKDKEIIGKLNKLVRTAIEGQSEILNKLGIFYDSFDYESVYLEKGKLKKILEQLKKTKRLKKDVQDRYILDQSDMKWEFEKEMKSPVLVLTRSNGTGLYPLRDIAYTIDKLKSAPVNIIVLGEDQKLYFKQLSATLELLGYRAPRVVHYSFILLKTKKGAKKMSTRRGEVILLSDFIKEAIRKARQEIKKRGREKNVDIDTVSEAIGIGAVRYTIAKVEMNKDITFNWEEALNFEGNTSPYLQYTHARASSIIKKLGKEKLANPLFNKVHEKEYALAKELGKFPKIVSDALEGLKPHLLCNYTYTLAHTFNDFYENCPVIQTEDKEIKARRVMLVQTTIIVLKIVLNLLGLPALEAM